MSAYDEIGSGVVYLYEKKVGPISMDTTEYQRARAYLCTGKVRIFVSLFLFVFAQYNHTQVQTTELTTTVRHYTGCFLRGAAAASEVTTWTLKNTLRPAVASPINQFGASLAIFHTSDADYSSSPFLSAAYVVAVGAPGDVTSSSAGGSNFAGSVYLFLGPHNFTSSTTGALVASDTWTMMTKVSAKSVLCAARDVFHPCFTSFPFILGSVLFLFSF